MKTFTITSASATFASGTLKLSAEQARARGPFLTPLGKNLFQIKSPVTFKRGETVGYDGEVSRAHLLDLDEVEQKKRKSKEDEGRAQAQQLGLDLPADMKPEDVLEAVNLATRAAVIAAQGEGATDAEKSEALQIAEVLSPYKA